MAETTVLENATPSTSSTTTNVAVTPASNTSTQAQDNNTEAVDKTILGEVAESTDSAELKDNVEVTDIPEKYEIKLPEGMQLDTQMLDTLTPVFKEMGLTGDKVQKLAEAYAPLVQKQIQQQVESSQKQAIEHWNKQIESWRGETEKALGANAKKELAFAAKAIEKSGVKGLREALDDTGMGNHPLLAQFFIWAGKNVSQDSFVDGKQNSPQARDFIETIYTHPTSKATLK